jgi:hypothetical protein
VVPVSLKSRLAKIARITAKITLGLVTFVILTVLVLFILNSFDAPLNAQAKALLTPPPNPYPSDDNIYLAMAGLDGPSDRPITDMGQERIAAYDRALDSMLLHGDVPTGPELKWSSARIQFSGKLALGSPRASSIWTDAKAHREEIAASLGANQQLYQRYLSLHQLKGYYETARPSFMAPVIVLPQYLRALFLADVANRIQAGSLPQQHEALTDLRQDIELWRTVLTGDGNLISKMVAVAWLHGDLILVADLISDPSIDLNSLDDLLDPILLRWDLKDYRIGNAFAAEYRARATLYRTIATAHEMVGTSASSNWANRVSNAVQAHFFKSNATENMDAEFTARRIALCDSEPSEFERNRQTYEDWFEKEGPHLSPSNFYNPMGKILASLSSSQKDSYSLRAYDVAAYQRLVNLAYQLKRRHIATADVESFMRAHPEWSTHPVDGKPFQWNADTGEFAVNTLGLYPTAQRFSVTFH